MITPDERKEFDAVFALSSAVQGLIDTSGLSYPQAAAILLVLICEMIQTSPDYSDDMPSQFVGRALPYAIEAARRGVARQNVQTTGTMQ